MSNLDLKEVILYDEKLPLGYRDVELERKILMNTYRKEGLREGYAIGEKIGREIGRKIGEEIGKKEGEEKVKKDVATYMLKMGYSVEDICAIIDLNPKIVEKLKS